MTYALTVYCYLGPKLRLVVRKHLALLGIESSEIRWSSSSKSISEVKGYSDWKYNEFLPLVKLALSGPEEAFQWLLSQLLRYSFCGICGNETKGLAHIRTKITFSSLASPSPSLLLSLILVWQHLEGTSQFYVRTSLIVVRNILSIMHRHSGDKCCPQRS